MLYNDPYHFKNIIFVCMHYRFAKFIPLILLQVMLIINGTAVCAKDFKFQEKTLKNGLKVVVIENHKAPLVKVCLCVKVGGRHDKSIMGISHFLEHLWFRGKTDILDYDEFQKFTKAMGAESMGNAYTSMDATVYHRIIHKQFLPLYLKLEASKLRSLDIAKVFASELEVVRQERKMRIDSSKYGALCETLNSKMFVLDDYRFYSPLGHDNQIKNFTIENIKQHHRDYYVPNNAMLVLVGDITPSQGFELAQQSFGDLKSKPLPKIFINTEPKEQPIDLSFKMSSPQTNLEVALVAFKKLDVKPTYRNRVICQLINNMLNSRYAKLYQHFVKHNNFAHSVEVAASLSLNLACFEIYISCVKEVVSDSVLKEVNWYVEQLKQGLIKEDEFQILKSAYKKSFIAASDNMFYGGDQIINTFIYNYDIKETADTLAVIDSITCKELNDMIKKMVSSCYKYTGILQPQSSAKAVIQPEAKILDKEQATSAN